MSRFVAQLVTRRARGQYATELLTASDQRDIKAAADRRARRLAKWKRDCERAREGRRS